MFFLKCICLMCYCICFMCATSFVNLDAKNRLSSMPKCDQARYEDNIDSLYKHRKNYPSFTNSSYEEKNCKICSVNNLQSLECYNFELTENVLLNKENFDINETNSLLKQFFSEQSFHRKNKYDLISDCAEFESHQGKHEFFNCFNLYLRFCSIKYQIINEYCVEDIDNFGKIGIKFLSQCSSLNYCLKCISRNFIEFSKDFKNCSVKFNLRNEILVKNYMKRFEDSRTCYNIFSSQKYLLNKICDNIQYFKHKKNTSIISYQICFHIYAYLFSCCCLAKIYNQICHAGNLTVINDTRLSDIMFMISDIFHAIYTTIPFFFHHLRCREDSFMDSSKLSRNDEYLFSFCSIYILSLFAFIMVQKFLIIIKEGLQIWIKFAKFCIILILFYFIKKDYVLTIIVNFGVPNCLLAMSILCNIISKKTVTEICMTFLIQLVLNSLALIVLNENYHRKCSILKAFLDYFPCFRHYTKTQNSEDTIESVTTNLQITLIQILLICILLLQNKYGSLFFLPSCFRSKIYENMVRDFKKMPQTEIERACMFCTNQLCEQELSYAKDCEKVVNEISLKVFYETKCGLVYHQKCFYESLLNYPNCPHCNCRIPNDGWDD